MTGGVHCVSDGASALPVWGLRPFVSRYEGYRLSGFEPGSHVGMPSTDLTVVLPIGAPVTLSRTAMVDQSPGNFGPLASGLGVRPIVIEHDGEQEGIQISLTSSGCRALFGVPPEALRQYVVSLDDLMGVDVRRIMNAVCDLSTWSDRFEVLDRVLSARVTRNAHEDRHARVDQRLLGAWGQLIGTESVTVAEVADNVGWSRRRLESRFAAEFAVTPRDAIRLGRFARSHAMLRRPVPPKLGEVAAASGYFDQAHMARDWRAFAGAAPSVWRANEVFAFVQDEVGRAAAGSPS
ncbi:MAG: helix-turn-helix domain-containing protein [Rhodococcus sp. (in: high G+C Gram-positive bacteria)]